MADGMGEGPNLTEASIPIAVEHPPEQAGMFAGLKAEWDKLPGWGKVAVVGAAVGLGFIVYERLRSGGLGLPLPSTDTSGTGGGSGFFGGSDSPTGGTASDGIPPVPGIPPLNIGPVAGIPDFPGSGIGPEGSGPPEATPAAPRPAPAKPTGTPIGVSIRAALGQAITNDRNAAASGPTYALTAPTAAMRALQYAQSQSSPPPQAPAPSRVPTGVARRYGLDGG